MAQEKPEALPPDVQKDMEALAKLLFDNVEVPADWATYAVQPTSAG